MFTLALLTPCPSTPETLNILVTSSPSPDNVTAPSVTLTELAEIIPPNEFKSKKPSLFTIFASTNIPFALIVVSP